MKWYFFAQNVFFAPANQPAGIMWGQYRWRLHFEVRNFQAVHSIIRGLRRDISTSPGDPEGSTLKGQTRVGADA